MRDAVLRDCPRTPGSLGATGSGTRTPADVSEQIGEQGIAFVLVQLDDAGGSILYIKTWPPHGGDTLFASMYAAFEALSDRMKTYLDGLTALHDGEHVYRGLYSNFGVADKPSYTRAEHPVVRTHPVTGRKALYVNRGFARRILDIPRDESEGVLRYLYEHMEIRCSNVGSAGAPIRWRSGITGVSSTMQCGTIGRIPVPASALRCAAASQSDTADFFS